MDEHFEKNIKTIINASYAIKKIYQQMATIEKKVIKTLKNIKNY